MAKTFVLVGATSGIGRQLAAELAGSDTTLYVLGRRGDRADDTPGVVHARCDVTAEEPQFPEIDEPIDGLAYLPGTINLKPFHRLRRGDFLRDAESTRQAP